MTETRRLPATLKGFRLGQLAKRAAHASILTLDPRGWSGKLHRPSTVGRQLAAGAIEIDPSTVFQPAATLIESYPSLSSADPEKVRQLGPKKMLYQDIPFSSYQGEWHFHPNQIGGYLVLSRPLGRAIRTAVQVRKFMAELPNGGLALYYPRTFATARFRTPEFVYSGIAQGQLLAGYTRLILEDKSDSASAWRDTASRIALSLQFPVERGGICADGSSILEGPNFRSCPEIILNGWLDALLHLHDYLQVAPDPTLRTFYEQNVSALVNLLPYFDSAPERLSRYSNLSPYSFRAHLARRQRETPPRIRVEYLSQEGRCRDYWIADLRRWGNGPASPYDNRVEKESAGYIDFSLSVAGQYDIAVKIDADCKKLSVDPGRADEASTIPHPTFRRAFVAPARDFNGSSTRFLVEPRDLGLIAGCPTNFMKPGAQNFYHSYHIAALYELALTSKEPEERRVIVDYADRWLAYIQDAKHTSQAERFAFSDPAKFAKMINNVRAIRGQRSFEQLRAQAAEGL